jgi:hypothetical protein
LTFFLLNSAKTGTIDANSEAGIDILRDRNALKPQTSNLVYRMQSSILYEEDRKSFDRRIFVHCFPSYDKNKPLRVPPINCNMTFQPKRRFHQIFNRNQKKRKNPLDSCSSKANLLPSNASNDHDGYDSRKLRRSAANKRHLNTDGSSCDQLRELCQKLPKESITRTPLNLSLSEGKENEEKPTNEKVESATGSSKTLKSDGSSGRELQRILEKLMLEENKNKKIELLPENGMQEKKLNYETRTPPLQASRVSSNTRSPSSPKKSQLIEEKEPSTPNSQNKFRFEMVDANEQSRLYLNSRKHKKKKKRRSRGNQQTIQRNQNLLKNCNLMTGMEFRSHSIASMSSCSIDSALDDRVRRRHVPPPPPPRTKPRRGNDDSFEALSCKASEMADGFKTVFVGTYGFASSWLGNCISLHTDEDVDY